MQNILRLVGEVDVLSERVSAQRSVPGSECQPHDNHDLGKKHKYEHTTSNVKLW